MPASTSFSLPPTNNPFGSEESMLDDSDFENLDGNNQIGLTSSRHYWLGKLTVLQLLGETVFRAATAVDTSDVLDGSLMSKLSDYPYQARMRQLATLSDTAHHVSQKNKQPANFQTLAIRVGALVANGNMDIKSSIAAIIQRGMLIEGHTSAHSAAPQTSTHPVPNTGVSDLPDVNPGNTERGAVELPRYTTALKQYGDRYGSAIKWINKQLSVAPLCWKVVLVVDGMTFEAEAGNTKEAKHLASQSACRSLAIEV